MRIAAFVEDLEARARIRRAFGQSAELRFVDSRIALGEAAVAGVDAIVLQPRDPRVGSTAPLVRSLRSDFPSTLIVGYCEPGRSESRDVLSLARAGIDDLVFRGTDDVRGILAMVQLRSEQHRMAKVVLRELSASIPQGVESLFSFLLEHAAEALTVERAAAALGVHRKTLVNRFARAGWPPPGAVISWTRLLAAARLLEDPGRTVEQVALQLEFQSGNALRTMLRRYTALRPAEVREKGGLRCVLRCFRQSIAECREPSSRFVAPLPPEAHFLQRPHP